MTVFGGTGADELVFGSEGVELPLFVQGDYVNISDSLVRGESGNDDIFFGEDTVMTRTLVNGNQGNDDIYLNGVIDTSTIQGGQDNDDIYVRNTVASSIINGNKGNDDIYGEDAIFTNVSVYGGQDDDDIEFRDAPLTNSLISGDVGFDYISFDSDNDDFLLQTSTVLGGTMSDEIDFGFENWDASCNFLGSEGDGLYVQVANSLIDGGEGNDSIHVADQVRIANSTILGGVGNDEIVISWYGEYGGDNGETDPAWGGLFSSLVDGGQGNDSIYVGNSNTGGGTGVSTVLGGQGDDLILGHNENLDGMLWEGQDGNDLIVGNGGADTILGGQGDDTLSGGLGGDLLTGGAGNDLFDYSRSPYDTISPTPPAPITPEERESFVTYNSDLVGSNIDVITDFDAAQDRFRLAYEVTAVKSVTAGFSTDWQTTAEAALGVAATGAALGNTEVALLTIDSGDNAGTYLLFQNSTSGAGSGTWNASYDSIIALGTPTGNINLGNFIYGGEVEDFQGFCEN